MHETVMQKPTGRNLTLSSNVKPRKTQEGLSQDTGMQKAQEKVNQSLNVHLQS